MKNSIRYELSVMVHKKEFLLALCAMMLFSLYALFYSVMLCNYDGDIKWLDFCLWSAEAYALLDSFLSPGQMFVYLFSFLVVLPHSMSYLNDRESGQFPLVLVRSGKRNYICSKLIACFIGNFLIIAVPLLLNHLFCRISFSSAQNFMLINGYGTESYAGSLSGDSFIVNLKYYPAEMFIELFTKSTWLYMLLHIGIVSFLSGLFGVTLLGLSMAVGKFRFILFVPVFVFFRFSSVVDSYLLNLAASDSSVKYTAVNPTDYILTTTGSPLSPYYLPILILISAAVCAALVFFGARGDRMLLGGGGTRRVKRK